MVTMDEVMRDLAAASVQAENQRRYTAIMQARDAGTSWERIAVQLGMASSGVRAFIKRMEQDGEA